MKNYTTYFLRAICYPVLALGILLIFPNCKGPQSLRSSGVYSLVVEKDSVFDAIFTQRMVEAEIPIPKGFAGRDVVWDTTRFSTVPVYYATDRKASGKSKPGKYFKGRPEHSGLHFGKCLVTIPAIHEIGEIERPGWWKAEFSKTSEKRMVLKEIASLTEPDFFQELQLYGLVADKREALVFIHGFNVTFEEAAMRAAQISYDVSFGGIPLLYSWSSGGSAFQYRKDGRKNALTVPSLEYFLENLASRGGFDQIHIVAHSMGNQALTQCLMDLARKNTDTPMFGQVILAAPDVDSRAFMEDIAPLIHRTAKNITLYASAKDKALLLSEKINGNPRAGEAGEDLVVVSPIETIDASDIDTDFLGHSYFSNTWRLINDLHYLINKGLPADKRFLKTGERGGWRYWFF